MMEKRPIETLELIVQALLAAERHPSPERIRAIIEQCRPASPVSNEQAEQLARHFEAIYEVHMDLGSVLCERDFEPWLEAAKVDIDPYYWRRYKQLLIERGFNGQVVASLDEVTDRTLGLLENPKKEGPWDRRGMVVGHVQSGKTANYAGLICKAADAGYRLIVVIAGVHNNLRNQTQLRIDEGFVGRDSARLGSKKDDRVIGVGRYDQRRRPVTFTSSLKDFDSQSAESVGVSIRTLNEPAVFVIKKNPNTLKNLIEWLKTHNAQRGSDRVEAPMLLIDDEADNASINIQHGRGAVAKINGQIRTLLAMFERSCYVGYTATPFANIFIDPYTDDDMFKADLFPRNFIVSLDPPTNYLGPTKVFVDQEKGFVRHIDDNNDSIPTKHQITLPVAALPQSLLAAVRTFVLARAIRIARGQGTDHNSMLINVSRFTQVQARVWERVHSYLGELKDAVRVHGALPFDEARQDPFIDALHRTWLKEYSDTGIAWSTVFPLLHSAASPIKAVTVNSQSAGSLNYKDYEQTGLQAIAIGGFSLSRGLTLEGLTVSYFLRNSTMYDTLLQMGRWFGYRPNYEDLCRIWMPEEAAGWYAHIAESMEELRDDFRAMEQAGATPEEFGLKVRSHPDTLIVTARNRMGAGKAIPVRIGLSNKFVETAILRRDAVIENRAAAKQLILELAQAGHPMSSASPVPGGLLLSRIPVEPVRRFIAAFRNDPVSLLTEPVPITSYIAERDSGELAEWDMMVAHVTRAEPGARTDEELFGQSITCPRRTAGTKTKASGRSIFVTNKQRVASRGVERTGLDPLEAAEAENAFRKTTEGKPVGGKEPNFPDRIYRAKRDRPLLLIYPLDLRDPDDQSPITEEAVIAWGISFPETELPESRVEYVVNEIWLRERLADEDGTDDDDPELEQTGD